MNNGGAQLRDEESRRSNGMEDIAELFIRNRKLLKKLDTQSLKAVVQCFGWNCPFFLNHDGTGHMGTARKDWLDMASMLIAQAVWEDKAG